jgi:hypothetical protein
MVIINIDTAKDSAEDIKKTIRYLQELVGASDNQESSFTNIFAENDPSPSSTETTGTAMGMFDNPFSESSSEDTSASSLLDDSDSEQEFSSDDAEVVAEDSSDAYIEIVEY